MKALRSLVILTGREVESYFFAPLMYVVLAVFLVLNGLAFSFSLLDMQGNVDATVRSFLGGSILFWINTLFVPPLLTMRLVAEERRNVGAAPWERSPRRGPRHAGRDRARRANSRSGRGPGRWPSEKAIVVEE